MELKDDSELRDLLREWKPPQTPESLEHRVLKSRRSWWRGLLFGYLRVPVPVACCLAVAIAIGGWSLGRQTSNGCSAPVVKIAQPQPLLKPVCAPNSSC